MERALGPSGAHFCGVCQAPTGVCVIHMTPIAVLSMIIPKINGVYAVAVVLLFGLGMVRLQK